jgi:chorismate dehydratase
MFKRVLTRDGTYTLRNELFGEEYHSISAGALVESFEKFVKPSGVSKIAKTRGEVRILEVGFGLGYNCLATLVEVLSSNPTARVEYLSFDLTVEQLRYTPDVPKYSELYGRLKGEILSKGFFRFENFTCRVLLGDARRGVFDVPESFKADAVFHDPFSPKKNPELWTLDFLGVLLKRMKEKGFWLTYSAALPVRRALYELGLKIFDVNPVGRRSPGTAATFSGEPPDERVYPISEKDFRRILKSPRAVPFRDPTLAGTKGEILKRWEEEVSQREEEVL